MKKKPGTESVEKISFSDIFDLNDIQNIQDLFADANGVASIITHPDGTPITRPSNFCRFCNEIIRKTDIGLKNCFKSDAEIGGPNASGPVIKQCLSGGLWDASASIIVGEQHLANWLIGQVKNENLDHVKMIEYARVISADERDFMEALDEVTVMSKEKFDKVARMLYAIANEFSSKAYQNIQLLKSMHERNQADEALRISREKYQTIFESTGTATLIVEEDTTISLANHECFYLTGYTQKELIGQKWTQYVETESLQNMIRNHNLRRTDPSLAPKKYEVKLVHKNGEIRYAMLDIGMVQGTGQSIVSILDISDRIKVEKALYTKAEELRLSEEKFKNIFEFASVGKSLTSLEGRINVNKAFCQLLGYTKREMNNINWRKLTHPDDIKQNEEIVRIILKGNKRSLRWEKRYIHKNGDIIWVDITTTLQRNRDGKPLYFITTVIDITEKKRAEEQIIQLNAGLEKRVIERTSQLEEANKELQAFAYSVSHDLRAPLRAINGFSEFIVEDYGDKLDPEGKRLLGLIRSNTQKMDQLITDILSLSRVARGEHKVSKVDMTKMALSMLSEIAEPGTREKVRFKIGKLPEAYADPTFMKQVWINLISNAIKFSSLRTKPQIEIGGYTESNFHIYFVKDNGVGFDPEYTHKLFGVFQRLHKAEEFEGTGVGLAIVQRIVHRHNGKVWAKGRVGRGATFYFSLPVENT